MCTIFIYLTNPLLIIMSIYNFPALLNNAAVNIIRPIFLSSYSLRINAYKCNCWVKSYCPLTSHQQYGATEIGNPKSPTILMANLQVTAVGTAAAAPVRVTQRHTIKTSDAFVFTTSQWPKHPKQNVPFYLPHTAQAAGDICTVSSLPLLLPGYARC